MASSPAFSFYAKDWLAATLTWALDARGAYATLLAYQWDAGSVPGDDTAALGRVLGVNAIKARAVWSIISAKFDRRDDGTWINPRLEEERTKQAVRRAALSENGSKGGRPKQTETNSFASAKANGNLNESLSSSSSFASSGIPSKNDGIPPSRPIISGEANPRTWGKIHGEHVPGFCDWVCFPEFLFAEFCRKSAMAKSPDGGAAYVHGWADAVRSRFDGEAIGDNLKFWRARWNESHTTKAETPVAQNPRQAQTANAAAVAQAHDTRRRRAEMQAEGMSDDAIEAVFEREYDERRRHA